jgi:hypothetical protein
MANSRWRPPVTCPTIGTLSAALAVICEDYAEGRTTLTPDSLVETLTGFVRATAGPSSAVAQQALAGVTRPYKPKEEPASYLGELLLKILEALHARPVVATLVVLQLSPNPVLDPLLAERLLLAQLDDSRGHCHIQHPASKGCLTALDRSAKVLESLNQVPSRGPGWTGPISSLGFLTPGAGGGHGSHPRRGERPTRPLAFFIGSGALQDRPSGMTPVSR